MLQDQQKTKVKRPPNGNDSSLETVDMSGQVPQVDDILAEVDKALKAANNLIEVVTPQKSCSC